MHKVMFGKCKQAKENFLSLYNAIHDTDLKINEKDNHPILLKCLALFAYAKFSEYIIIGETEGCEDPIGYALDRCIAENILADYFEKLKREDRGMIFGEYSYKDHLKVACEEAFEDGEEAAKITNAKNALNMGLPPEQAAQITFLPLEKVLALKEELAAQPSTAR